MNSRTLLRSKLSAAIRAWISASWLAIVLASACCSEETRAYKATCTVVMTHSLLRPLAAGHGQDPGTAGQRRGICGAEEPARHRPSGGDLVGGDAVQT